MLMYYHLNYGLHKNYSTIKSTTMLYIYNDVTRKSCEKGLITKICITTHTNLTFNMALYSSALAKNILAEVKSYFMPNLFLWSWRFAYFKFITMKHSTLLLMLGCYYHLLLWLVPCHLSFPWLTLMTCCVTKATPTHLWKASVT